MNVQLIGSSIGAMLAITAMMPNSAPVVQELQPSPSPATGAATKGNLTISTIPGNTWVRIDDYTYSPRILPNLDLTGWDVSFPVKAVVRDAQNTCVGRITNESGQLQFIFVEADPPMCGGATPGQRGEVASNG